MLGDVPAPRFRTALAIIGAGLAARVTIFTVQIGEPDRFLAPDSTGYLILGRRFAESYLGSGADGPSVLSLARPPGYPLFLSVAGWLPGPDVPTAVLVQILLSLVSVGLVYVAGARLFGATAGTWAAALVALDPVSIVYTNHVLSETLFTTLLLVTLVLIQRVSPVLSGGSVAAGRHPIALLAGAGAVLGLAVLTRPVALLLPIALLPFLGRKTPVRTRLLSIAVFLSAFALIVGGWVGRNAAVSGVPLLTTTTGKNLSIYAASALAQQTDLSVDEARGVIRDRLPATSEGTTREAAELSRARTDVATDVLAEHPAGLAVVGGRGLFNVLAGPGDDAFETVLSGNPEPGTERAHLPFVLVSLTLLLILYLGTIVGVHGLWTRRAYLRLSLPMVFALYLLLTSAGPLAYSRFRVPLVVFLALVAGLGLETLSRRRRPDDEPEPTSSS